MSTVKRWLVESGIPESAILVPRSKTWVRFDTTVAHLETLVKARYHVYDHIAARDEHIGTEEYHLPEDVAPHVDFVVHGVAFTRLGRSGLEKRKSDGSGAGGRPLRPLDATIQLNPGKCLSLLSHSRCLPVMIGRWIGPGRSMWGRADPGLRTPSRQARGSRAVHVRAPSHRGPHSRLYCKQAMVADNV